MKYLYILVILASLCFPYVGNADMVIPTPRTDVLMGFTPRVFSTPSEYVAELERLKDIRPGVLEYYIGPETSAVGGYNLYYIVLGDPNKPAYFISAVSHAWNERNGADITLKFIERFLDPYDPQYEINNDFLNNYCIVAVPIMNPYGYFFDNPDDGEGLHHNGNAYSAGDLSGYGPPHDLTNFQQFGGVNLNRNYYTNTFSTWPDLPWREATLWNGQDYGIGNYFMMPYYNDGSIVHYDPWNDTYPSGTHNVYTPNPAIYDGKGAYPFSEPETRLVRDLCDGSLGGYNVIAHWDLHTMNPWQTNSHTIVSNADNYVTIRDGFNSAVKNSNARYSSDIGMSLPAHDFAETYDSVDAPFATNWAANHLKGGTGVLAVAMETGTGFTPEHYTDTYMEALYRWLGWGQQNVTKRTLATLSIAYSGAVIPGEMKQLRLEGTGTDGNPYYVHPESWMSSDESVVTVSSDGVMTVLQNGSAIVTATAESMTAQIVLQSGHLSLKTTSGQSVHLKRNIGGGWK